MLGRGFAKPDRSIGVQRPCSENSNCNSSNNSTFRRQPEGGASRPRFAVFIAIAIVDAAVRSPGRHPTRNTSK